MTMNNILLIETATDICSAAVSHEGIIISSERIDEPRQQASRLTPLILSVVNNAGMSMDDIDAVAVSSGPGSYTGLRTGVSTAKGICFGAGFPLIGICTLTVTAMGVLNAVDCPDTLIIPMIDARRMEVYTALFDASGKRLSEISAVILEPETFSDVMGAYRRIIITGDGAAKYENILAGQYRDRCVFLPGHPCAEHMAVPAWEAMKEKRFEDTAYFEPFYLKEFQASSPSRRLEAILHPESKKP